MMRDNWDIALTRQTRRQRAGAPYVSLNRRGEIAMNDKAFKMIRCPYNVTLLYDRERRAIGVKCPVMWDEHFFRVRRYGRGRRIRVVRAARLLKQFGITIERTLIFSPVRAELFRDEPMLVLELTTSSEPPLREAITEPAALTSRQREVYNFHLSYRVG